MFEICYRFGEVINEHAGVAFAFAMRAVIEAVDCIAVFHQVVGDMHIASDVFADAMCDHDHRFGFFVGQPGFGMQG